VFLPFVIAVFENFIVANMGHAVIFRLSSFNHAPQKEMFQMSVTFTVAVGSAGNRDAT